MTFFSRLGGALQNGIEANVERTRSPSPYRISFTGIDGAGKDTITRDALTLIANEGMNVVKLGRPAYAIDGGSNRQMYRRTTETIDRLHHQADLAYSPGLIVAVNAINVIIQSRMLERAALGTKGLDVLASSRDGRVDPAVYLSYYVPDGVSRSVSTRRRLETMQRLTGLKRDMVILLKVDPDEAMQRIDARMEAEAKLRETVGIGPAGVRDKWHHMHENPSDLAELASGYGEALDILQEIQPSTTVIEIDTTHYSKEAVAGLAHTAIKQAMRDMIPSGERIILSESLEPVTSQAV